MNYLSRPTYRACTLAPVAFTSTTDVFLSIIGSATKHVVVQRIILSCPTLTATTLLDMLVQKCSAAPTGGVPSTALVHTPLQTGIAATAVATAFTTGATIGALIGTVESRRVLGLVPALTVADSRDDVVFDFRGVGNTEGVSLDGVAQALIVKFGSVPGSTTSMTAVVEWTEQG